MKTLNAKFKRLVNSFLVDETKELYQLGTNDIMSDYAVCVVKNSILWARRYFRNFVTVDSLSKL